MHHFLDTHSCPINLSHLPILLRKKRYHHRQLIMSTLNVFRYSLLGAGVVYGFIHRNSLESAHKEESRLAQWSKEEKLIAEAKAQFAKTAAPQSTA